MIAFKRDDGDQVALPIGARIKAFRPMTRAEVERAFMCPEDIHHTVYAIELDDGTLIWPAADHGGNHSGFLGRTMADGAVVICAPPR